MPFPADPISFHGGCNCHAIRYRITLPPFSHRSKSPYDPNHTPTNPLDAALPMSMICHCNDCRRANGQLISFGLATELSTIEFSLAPRSTPALTAAQSNEFARLPVKDRDAADDERSSKFNAPWIPASSIYGRCEGALFDLTADTEESSTKKPTVPSETGPETDTWLRTYRSSYNKTRSFCARCGTPLFYFLTYEEGKGYPDPWPTQLDIWTGTVDRVDLEGEAFRPGREVWLDFGVEWVGGFVGAEGMRKCRTWK